MEKELEKVKGALEDFGKKVVEAVKKGKGEADKVTRIAQVRIEMGSLQRQRKDLQQELGELFYNNYSKPNKKSQDAIAETVTHIAEIDKKVASLKRALKAIREDKPSPRRRGRPPKSTADKAEASRRRGRPSKSAAAKAEAPKRRGRPPKSAAAKAEAPKRRGRPPKNKK